MRRLLLIIASAALLFTQTGCVIVAPFVDSFKKMGATPADRRQLFTDELKKFGDALYWGKGEAGTFVGGGASQQLREELSTIKDDIHYVDTSVRHVEFDDGAYVAHVLVTVKYYKIPFYIVTEQHETQVWKWGFNEGWKLDSREIKKS